MKKYLLLISLLASSVLQAQPTYNYVIQVMPPFGKVVINNTIQCPNQTEGTQCRIQNQQSNTDILVTGIKNHVCDFRIHQDGSIELNRILSYFCDNVIVVNATETKTGHITLPKHF